MALSVEGTSGPPTAVADIRTDFRTALRRLAKAVVVVTCRGDDGRFAMAATAISELSMDPPSLLVCVNKNASIFGSLTRVSHFGISILHSSHRAISERCSGADKGETRFSLGTWNENGDGVPYLIDAQACIFCRNDKRVDYGTHGVFFGLVQSAHTMGDVSPLIYMDGDYSRASERV